MPALRFSIEVIGDVDTEAPAGLRQLLTPRIFDFDEARLDAAGARATQLDALSQNPSISDEVFRRNFTIAPASSLKTKSLALAHEQHLCMEWALGG